MQITELSSRTVSKILKRLNIGCFNCGWNKASCDIHHIIPKKHGGTNDHSNLTVLCPNCHREAHQFGLTNFQSFLEKVGDAWEDVYYPEGTSNPKIRKIISEGMKKAHQEGRANSF